MFCERSNESIIHTEIERLPVNEALLQLVTNPVQPNGSTTYKKLLPPEDHTHYLVAKRCIEELALYLKPCQPSPNQPSTIVIGTGVMSRPMQRKLVTLVGCQLIEPEGRARAVRAARSLGERSVTELILQHQNPQQLNANLWAAVRARGCQFLGPAMQEDVLQLVLLALEDGSALSRKVLVMFVVQRLETRFPQASKTSIGHVVQLLYRASCFKVSKREGDSSLMQLKEEFRTYNALRREHDAQIVQIATEAGLRIAPDQWSALLYGDVSHKSHMQSIIDKLQNPQSFAQSVQELVIALQRTPDPGQLSSLRPQLELLAAIDPSPEAETPTLAECRAVLEAVKAVVTALVEFIRLHGHRKSHDTGPHNLGPGQPKYKISMCRDLTLRGSCPRSSNCTFAHSDMELDKYRSKNRKLSLRPNIPGTNNTDVKTDNSVNDPNNTTFNQNDDVSYHSMKSNDNVHRESNSMQHHALMNENNFIESMSNYMLPSPQGMLPIVPAKNIDMHCSHYIMPNTPVDYTTPTLGMWDTSSATIEISNCKKKTLATLLQRKMEILNQLEKIVYNKQVPQMKTNYDVHREPLSSNFSIWTNTQNSPTISPSNISCSNNVQCVKPILFTDELVPFDSSSNSKYGPISKLSRNLLRSNSVQSSNFYTEGVTPAISAYRPIPNTNSITSWYYGNQPYATIATNGGVQSVSNGFADSCITFGHNISDTSTYTQLPRSECMPKDIMLESQKVKQQLKHLEKKINDLKLATEGAAFTAEERLAHELQMIEADIREKERDIRNWNAYSTIPWIQSSDRLLNSQNQDYKDEEEDTYEAGIANDIRKLELRLEFELQEDENSKK